MQKPLYGLKYLLSRAIPQQAKVNPEKKPSTPRQNARTIGELVTAESQLFLKNVDKDQSDR